MRSSGESALPEMPYRMFEGTVGCASGHSAVAHGSADASAGAMTFAMPNTSNARITTVIRKNNTQAMKIRAEGLLMAGSFRRGFASV